MSGSHREIERNDPCPCGSGRKYKKCNVQKCASPSMRKFKATLIPSKANQLFAQATSQITHATSTMSTEDLAKRIRSAGTI